MYNVRYEAIGWAEEKTDRAINCFQHETKTTLLSTVLNLEEKFR